jgi:ribokinase
VAVEPLALLVVGSVNMDLVMQTERVPRGGETLLGRRYSYIPGGKGANQAVAAARLGLKVTFVGCVGSDAHGAALRENLLREGIEARHLRVDEGSQTGFAVIMVEADGQNRIVVFPGANMSIRATDLAGAFEGSHRGVMINLEIPQQIVQEVCRLAHRRGLPVILDAGPVRDFDFAALAGLEVISPNETEAQAISGIECTDTADALAAARRIVEITPSRYAVIKLGRRGALLYDPAADSGELVPALEVQAVDSTAAGDAFTAALAAQYLRHGDMRRAVRYANAVGALSTMRLGAQPSMPNRQEVQVFLQERGLNADGA